MSRVGMMILQYSHTTDCWRLVAATPSCYTLGNHTAVAHAGKWERTMSVYLGSIGGISVRAKPSAFLWSVVLWAAATEFSQIVLKTPLPLAIIEGLAIVAIHWASD